MTSQKNFENIVNMCPEKSIAQVVPEIQSELQSFSNYVQSNMQSGVEYI
jgi:hypothetical protein